MSKLENDIREIVEGLLPDKSYFIVDIKMSAQGRSPKLDVLLDGDSGINIDVCTSISRRLSGIMEEKGLFESGYLLEVGSPGVDHPLTTVREYRKNLGRHLKVTRKDNSVIKGILKEVKDEEFVLDYTIKEKGKKAVIQSESLKFDQVIKTIVEVSFN